MAKTPVLAGWLSRHAKVSSLARIRSQTGGWSQFLHRHTESARLALHCEADEINRAVQIEHGSIDDQILEVRILMLTTIVCLHVVCAGTIFRLNPPAGSIQVQSFTADDIGNT